MLKQIINKIVVLCSIAVQLLGSIFNDSLRNRLLLFGQESARLFTPLAAANFSSSSYSRTNPFPSCAESLVSVFLRNEPVLFNRFRGGVPISWLQKCLLLRIT